MLFDPQEEMVLELSQHNLDLLAGGKFSKFDHYYVVTNAKAESEATAESEPQKESDAQAKPKKIRKERWERSKRAQRKNKRSEV